MNYTYATGAEVVSFFGSCSKREREELLRIFRFLADSPFQSGVWFRRTSSGRELQVQRFGKWLVTYWADHPVCEVRIVDVERVIP